MGNLSQKEMEEIESNLNALDSDIEKNVKEEYYTLKQSLTNQNQKRLNLDLGLYLNQKKLLVNPINVSKRLERMGKWIKMIFPSKATSTKFKRSNTSSYDTSSKCESDHSSNIHSSGSYKKQNVILKISSPHRRKNIDVNLAGFDQNQVNLIEKNLRLYYSKNKDNYKDRISKGPPDSLRWISWLIVSNVPYVRSYKIYLQYLLDDIEDNVDMQICKDLNRTRSSFNTLEPNLSIGSGNYEDMLYRILRAFSNADKDLGYCQGLNFITGFLLSVSNNNEIETFYMLITLLSNAWNLRGFFLDQFPLLSYYIDIFDAMMEKECNDIRKHLIKIEMPNELWISKWIQTLYTMSLPYDINLRIWDNLLTNGIEFIVSFSIALIIALEKDIKTINDAFDILELFKAFFACVSLNEASNHNTYTNTVTHTMTTNLNDQSIPQIIYSTDPCLKDKKVVQLNHILIMSEKMHKSYVNKDFFEHIKQTFIQKENDNANVFKPKIFDLSPSNEKFLIAQGMNSFNNNMNKTNFKSEISEEENTPFCYQDDISHYGFGSNCNVNGNHGSNSNSNNTTTKNNTEQLFHFMRGKSDNSIKP